MSVKATPCKDELLFSVFNEYMGKNPTEKCTEGLKQHHRRAYKYKCLYLCMSCYVCKRRFAYKEDRGNGGKKYKRDVKVSYL